MYISFLNQLVTNTKEVCYKIDIHNWVYEYVSGQLKMTTTWWTYKLKENKVGMMKILFLFIMFNILTFSLYSQNKTINGRVISDDFETMPGVSS